MSGIRVGSLNLNGARDIRKRALLFELIKQKGIDIALVQETHSDRANEVDWRKEWEGGVSFSHMNSTRGGVAVKIGRASCRESVFSAVWAAGEAAWDKTHTALSTVLALTRER